jgi:CcmD family protein
MPMKRWLVLLLLLVAPAARAGAPGEPPPATGEWQQEDRSAMMRMGEGGYASTTLVTAAYSFIWVMVLGFVASLWVRSRRVERELSELAQRIARAEAAPPVPRKG